MRWQLIVGFAAIASLPASVSAQIFETAFDDLDGWAAQWPDDDWRVVRGRAGPTTDETCISALGQDYANDPGCGFGGALEPHDNLVTTGPGDWTDVRITANFVNFDDDAVGFVFRRQDADNYYLYLQSRGTWPSAALPSVDQSGPTSRLIRVRGGAATLLASSDVAFTRGRNHTVRIDAVSNRITVYFDANGDGNIGGNERVFQVEDDRPLAQGQVGLWAYDNRNFYVDWMRVFEIDPPPTPERFAILEIDRGGKNVRYGYNLAASATGFIKLATGRCADVDPQAAQPVAGIGRKIVGKIKSQPDTDYCVIPCARNAEGTACGDEVDFTTRGASIDTRALSPGHLDVTNRRGNEKLHTRATGSLFSTTARLGQYTLLVDGRRVDFDVDARARATLPNGDLGGRASTPEGVLTVDGFPVVLDTRNRHPQRRTALLGADYRSGYGGAQGRAERTYRLLPGDYLWRVSGIDLAFEVNDDGSVGVPPESAEFLTRDGNRLTASNGRAGEAVAFRVTVTNQGPQRILGGGLLNGRSVHPNDDGQQGMPGVRAYARADANSNHFGNLAASLGYLLNVHAWYAFDRLDPGRALHKDVLVFPSNPNLEFIGDVGGTPDNIAASAPPFEIALFDEDGEPTEGEARIHELDVDGRSEGALRRRFVNATGQQYGTMRWQILARASTPSALTVHWMNPGGTKVRVSFTANRQAAGAILFVERDCALVDWAEYREQAMGIGTSFSGDLRVTTGRDYCARARATNAAGGLWGPPVSFSTRQIQVDASSIAGRFRVQQPGPNLVQLADGGEVHGDLGLRMGDVTLDQGGDLVELVIDKDGRVTYDDGLEGVLEGAGGRTLTINGVPVHVDATELTGDAALVASEGASAIPLGSVEGGGERDIQVLPGSFALIHGERHGFQVDLGGLVRPANDAVLAGGDGQLRTRGRTLNLDVLPVPGEVAIASASGQPTHATVPGAGVREVKLLPGSYTLEVARTGSSFTVSEDVEPSFAGVDAELGFRSCVDHGEFATGEGQGTDTLVVRADPCSITADILCEEECGVEDDVFQINGGAGEARGTVRYASGQPVRPDEEHGVAFEVNGGELSDANANTVDGTARVGYAAPGERGDYLLRVRTGGLSSSKPFVVIPIRDLAPPVITPGDAIVAEQQNADGTALNLNAPVVRDNADPAPVVTNDAPRVFPLGRTVVTWRAVDFNGNASQATQTVTVVDTTAPTLRVAEEVELEATSPAGTAVDLDEVQVHDICDADPELVRDGPRRFPVGETEVSWTAIDDSGNETAAQTLVRIVDTTPPRITFPQDEILIEATHDFGARSVALPSPLVGDNGDPNPDVHHNAPGILGYGRHIVTWFAVDASGNEASLQIPVRVMDATAPRIDVAGAPDGWTQRAELRINVFDVGDASPQLGIDPPPDASAVVEGGTVVAAYTTEGVYEVSVSAVDDAGNQARRALRAFGVDGTTPRIRIGGSIPRGADIDPDDDSTWPVVFGSELLELRIDASDTPAQGVSGIAQVRLVLDPEAQTPRVLVDHMPAAQGADPAAGPPAVRGVVCDRVGMCDEAGRIRADRIGAGSHVVEIIVNDVAGNEATQRVYFRAFSLQAALLAARDQVDALAAGDGLADQGVEALQEASAALAAAAAVADGQPAGVDAPVDLTGTVLTIAQGVGPALRRAERFGVDTGPVKALYGRALYWAVATFGQIGDDPEVGDQDDYDAAVDDYLPDAQAALNAGDVDAALSSLGDAYFLFDNALRPLSAAAFGEAVRTARTVRDQIAAYIEDDNRPGAAGLDARLDDLNLVVADLEQYLADAGEFEDEEEQLRALAEIDANQYLATMVALARLARAMQAAAQDGVWIRNWSWGLVQTTMLLSDLGARRARSVNVNPDNIPLYDEADDLVAEGSLLVQDRRTDAFFELYLAERTECVMFLVYNSAFEPVVAAPEGCE